MASLKNFKSHFPTDRHPVYNIFDVPRSYWLTHVESNISVDQRLFILHIEDKGIILIPEPCRFNIDLYSPMHIVISLYNINKIFKILLKLNLSYRLGKY